MMHPQTGKQITQQDQESEDNRGPIMDTLGEAVIRGKKRKKTPLRKQKRNHHRRRDQKPINTF